ncbi:MAG TPA: ABC transporter ATP-binding protein [Casimicrobiaceae bacterium]|nr:ABC transporter ATP-binding protein [Casimicrobiaceae bacterium]
MGAAGAAQSRHNLGMRVAVPRLELCAISKAYPSVIANDAIDLTVLPGEIHAVLGENGAGKSTLMKIICGIVKPDAGSIRWNGSLVKIANPAQARALGIGMVFQHFSLFETLTVAENIELALGPGSNTAGLKERVGDVSGRYGLPLDPRRHIHTMSAGERQRVEIVRCLLQEPTLLILDEPTSVLTPQATAKFFQTLRRLAAEGCSILYISHKLDEILALCTRATVLRAGRVTGSCDPRQETSSSLAKMMIGGELPHPHHRAAAARGDGGLGVRHLSLAAEDPFGTDLVDIELSVRGGEIVGIAGVSGNGQKELLAALSGERTVEDAGAVVVNGTPAGRLDAGERRALGLAFVPEERLGRGAVPEMSLADNALLTAWRQELTHRGTIRTGAMRTYAAAVIARFNVKATGPETIARSLSGGNLQKFIVGREMLQGPRAMIAAQPTWGVDVGASAQIRQALIDLRDEGVAVLVVSEELDELLEICDRIAVMASGRLSAARPARESDAETIGQMMSGSFIGTDEARPGSRAVVFPNAVAPRTIDAP